MKAIEAIKVFFSTPDKPVTSKELMAFAKADKAGYEELKELVLAETADAGTTAVAA